jgi:hypothetical protein
MEMCHLKYFVTVAERQNCAARPRNCTWRCRPFMMVGYEKPTDGQIRLPEIPSQSPKDKAEIR